MKSVMSKFEKLYQNLKVQCEELFKRKLTIEEDIMAIEYIEEIIKHE